jgi:transposase-like protein
VTLPARPPKEQLAELIREEAGNISAVARRLQVCSRTIYRWLRASGLELKDFRLEADREAVVGGGR